MWIQVTDFTLENNLITLITSTLAGLVYIGIFVKMWIGLMYHY